MGKRKEAGGHRRILLFRDGRERFRAPSGERFSLVVTGDCCPGATGLEALREGRGADVVAAVKPFIASADIRLAQWETPLTAAESPSTKSGPNLRRPPDAAAILPALGIDTALLANNHIGDQGPSGVRETLKHLRALGIRTAGAGATLEEASRPLEIDVRGLRLAVINVAENEFGMATPTLPGAAPLDPLAVIRTIRESAGRGRLVLVVVHGGHERYPLPSPRMVETYRAFVEAGASAVINCHTHCPAGIEWWAGAPIVYSPGNFFFPWENLGSGHLNAMWWIGYVPKLYFDRRGVYGLEVLPVRFDNARLHALGKGDRGRFNRYLARLSRVIADDRALRRYFEAWSARQCRNYPEWIRDQLAGALSASPGERVRQLMPIRNLLTCESHHDLIRQYFRLVEEGREESVLKAWPAIQALQSPPWAEAHWQSLRPATS